MATGEFDRIARFTRVFERARVPVGIGDDCAVIRPRAGRDLAVTTDSLVEDVHFTRAHFTLEDIGHKALAVNLSDLASMGARPVWFVCALELPQWVDDRGLSSLARSMSRLAKRSGIALVGGNFSRAEKLSITLTVTGEVPRNRAVRRDGGRVGDLLYVSGTLGDARLGLSLMQQPDHPHARGPLLRQRRPEPRLALGELARRFATAAVDLSDGLAQDLGHLCGASKVGAEVVLAQLPVSTALRRHAGVEAPLWAARGGEDYELLLAIPVRRRAAFERACHAVGQVITPIGSLTAGRTVRFCDASGRTITGLHGFDHFK